ncbi:resistin-like isoform X1 [Rhineura floridana]|uniref:resistin-like isoform X1 n=2 Tax=Rhineura floridana TaxID=261503 RepID=UPI002AC8122B|nr:resistin-like isoform X1 [Rhineura floridana]
MQHTRILVCTRIMKYTIFLLFAVLMFAKYSSAQECPIKCAIESLINQKIQSSVDATVSSFLAKTELICTTASARGADAHCPSGHKATGCACGMACGSWDIRGETSCHCQCAKIDWTSARCCRVGIVG